MITVDFWAIVVASIVAFIIGALWYSPLLFGKQWMSLIGMKERDIEIAKEKGMTKLYIVQFIITLITFTVLGFAISSLSITSARDAGFIGLLAWVGFIVPGAMGSLIWERKPFKLIMINSIGTLVCWVIGAAIIGMW
jgi:hypothetical protein